MNFTQQTTQEQLAAFIASITEPADILDTRMIPRKGRDDLKPFDKFYRAADLPDHYVELTEYNRRDYGVYVGPNPRKAIGGTSDKDVLLARCLFADLDHVTLEDARQRLAVMPTPTVIINSGHGVHAYWRLAAPITDLERWKEWQVDLIALLDSDPVIKNPSRVMRLPAFLNHGDPVNV